jgi:hypothetical protein
MQLLADWTVDHHGVGRRIELYQGDLAALPPEHAVDLLVVSAFPNDYAPTERSLMGALFRAGISVGQLSERKYLDLRSSFSCWISEPIVGSANFRRIMCIESGWRGTPLEISDDIFRALAPSSMGEFSGASIAMPLIGAGDQGYRPAEVMASTLRAAIFWLRRGLNIPVLKIVVHGDRSADLAREAFLAVKRKDELEENRPVVPTNAVPPDETGTYDLFLSYAHKDSEVAALIIAHLAKNSPHARVFYDRHSLSEGDSWLMRIAESLDASQRVVALYTPNYWASKYCKDEFTAALLRQNDTGKKVLFPIYYEATKIPYFFLSLQYVDCREADPAMLTGACDTLCRELRLIH